jgi:D-galacturonate reductase
VSVPDHLHYQLGKTLLEQGLHCLIVKPLVPTLEQARSLCELARGRGLHGAVELHKRFDEGNLAVKRLLMERALGRLSYMTVSYSQRIDVPLAFRAWADRTNIFQYLGVHYVDLIHFMTGMLPLRVLARGTRGILEGLGINTYDSVHAMIEWAVPGSRELGLFSQFAVGWIDSKRSTAVSDQRYYIAGELGRIECDQTNRGLTLISNARGAEAINPYFSQFLADAHGKERFSGYGFQSIERFLLDVQALRAGTTTARELEHVRPSFADALVSTAAIEAVNRSLAGDAEWIEVDATL